MNCYHYMLYNNLNYYIKMNLPKETLNEIEKFLDLNIDNLISTYVFRDEKNINELLKKIQNKFELKNFPYKIICIDISHNSWENPVWWISAMIWWILSKRDYRHIKIPKELGWNDYESLKYCLNKYFKNNYADLVVIDWWKWQLNIIYDLPNNILLNTDFISLGKWKARTRKWKLQQNTEVFYTPKKEIPVNYDLLEDKLLIKLRDEAHRFSNKFREKQRKISK